MNKSINSYAFPRSSSIIPLNSSVFSTIKSKLSLLKRIGVLSSLSDDSVTNCFPPADLLYNAKSAEFEHSQGAVHPFFVNNNTNVVVNVSDFR